MCSCDDGVVERVCVAVMMVWWRGFVQLRRWCGGEGAAARWCGGSGGEGLCSYDDGVVDAVGKEIC